jgi:hypothetical protein
VARFWSKRGEILLPVIAMSLLQERSRAAINHLAQP